MTEHQLHRLLLPALVILLPALGGCPIPIPRTNATSAPLTGVYRHQDGSPVRNAWIRLSTDGRDSACMHYILTTLTDSGGRFHFPQTVVHNKVIWVIPAFDAASPRYSVCFEAGNHTEEAYHGRGTISGDADPETASCDQWTIDAQLRVSCNSTVERLVAVGGHWTSDGGVGWYRAIVTNGGTPFDRPHLYLQWLTGDSSKSATVVLIAEVHVDPKVWYFYDPLIWQEGGRWYLTLDGMRDSFMTNSKSSHVRLRLGPPGEVSTVQPY